MKTQPSACSLLRHLDFSNMGLCPVHCGSTWHELVELLPFCTNLQTISFGALSGYHAARLLCTLARYNPGVKDSMLFPPAYLEGADSLCSRLRALVSLWSDGLPATMGVVGL